MKSLMLKPVMLLLGLFLLLAPIGVLADQSGLITGPACEKINKAGAQVPGCTTSKPGIADQNGLAYTIVHTLLYAAGIVSFIFILVGGFRYLGSTGDPQRIQQAKDTVLYAIIGLIITFLAFPVSGFVIKAAGG